MSFAAEIPAGLYQVRGIGAGGWDIVGPAEKGSGWTLGVGVGFATIVWDDADDAKVLDAEAGSVVNVLVRVGISEE